MPASESKHNASAAAGKGERRPKLRKARMPSLPSVRSVCDDEKVPSRKWLELKVA